jgi:hypothetical protein
METICFSETSADFQRPTRRYIPEHSTLQRNNRLLKQGFYIDIYLREETVTNTRGKHAVLNFETETTVFPRIADSWRCLGYYALRQPTIIAEDSNSTSVIFEIQIKLRTKLCWNYALSYFLSLPSKTNYGNCFGAVLSSNEAIVKRYDIIFYVFPIQIQ